MLSTQHPLGQIIDGVMLLHCNALLGKDVAFVVLRIYHVHRSTGFRITTIQNGSVNRGPIHSPTSVLR